MALLGAVFALAGCEGDDGKDGATGPQGPPGQDGTDGVDGKDATIDAVQAAINSAEIESCGTCHMGQGDAHQAVYDDYVNSQLAMEITAVRSVAVGGTFDIEIDASVTKNDKPYIDPLGTNLSVESVLFAAVQYEGGDFLNPGGGFYPAISGSLVSNGDGTYTLAANLTYDPLAFTGGAIVGRIADGRLDIEERQAGKRVSMYSDIASAAYPIGNIDTFASAANVEGCQNCHGTPYRKHGNLEPVVDNVSDFVFCKGCHNDVSNGGHPEWQFMVDDPVSWANGEDPTPEQAATYAYKRTLMNDVHMSHAMEFPFPQSIANCNSCHAGKLESVLADENFALQTCKSCHPLTGDEAYVDSHRAPAFLPVWTAKNVLFHTNYDTATDCTNCHNSEAGAAAPSFATLHTGYDARIFNPATGEKWADVYTNTIDSVTYDEATSTMSIQFHTSDPGMTPEILVSLYGWDTKNFLVPSHDRDDSELCLNFRRDPPEPTGCRMEWEAGVDNGLFTVVTDGTDDGIWEIELDFAAFVPTNTAALPTLIGGDVRKAEVTMLAALEVDGVGVGLDAVTQTFDFIADATVDDYFKGAYAAVDADKCDACHLQLAVTWHGNGSGGDVLACKNCHNTTYGGSHLEMASRSIDNYVHAIHSFQDFDPGETFEAPFDPVLAKRYDQHIEHAFPYFTAQACEACHVVPGVGIATSYNVPDQAKSMPGLHRGTDTVDTWYEIVGDAAVERDATDRNVGNINRFVAGPASRSCGGCHRAEFLNEDDASGLASWNAHTKAFGTYAVIEDNANENPILFGIIDKIMTMFE
jgi:hypothetical protein